MVAIETDHIVHDSMKVIQVFIVYKLMIISFCRISVYSVDVSEGICIEVLCVFILLHYSVH